MDSIGHHATGIAKVGEDLLVIYRSTVVVKASPVRIKLDSGGWRTATTKRRMNQASNQLDLGFVVYQKKKVWYVDYKGETIKFEDGMVLER
jgi:hypothetical protein